MIKSTHAESSGSLSFLEIYNSTGKVVKQGNKRRWAGMCVLSDIPINNKEVTLHPDTE
jgi:ribonucleotide reductase alpha subunit